MRGDQEDLQRRVGSQQRCKFTRAIPSPKMNLDRESNGHHIAPAAAPVKHEGAVTAADQLFGGKQFLKY